MMFLEDNLTGAIRFRQDKKGRLILQVEDRSTAFYWLGFVDFCPGPHWRDAKMSDFLPRQIDQLLREGLKRDSGETAKAARPEGRKPGAKHAPKVKP